MVVPADASTIPLARAMLQWLEPSTSDLMRTTYWLFWRLPVWGLLFVVSTLAAQDVPVDATRPLVTRADLQSALDQADQIAGSDAYSAAFKEGKRAEAAVIRERLLEGDFYVGDQVTVEMTGDSGFSGIETVRFGRVMSLRGLPDIPMRGVLRSEVQDYLTTQIARFLKDPDVKIRPLIRLTVLGGIGKPGFYQLDADLLLSDALMRTGGIGNGTDFKSSKVRRNGVEIIDGETIAKAIVEGRTLDQLNLRAGDEIEIGAKSRTNWLTTLRTFAAIPALILSGYTLGKLFGIF